MHAPISQPSRSLNSEFDAGNLYIALAGPPQSRIAVINGNTIRSSRATRHQRLLCQTNDTVIEETGHIPERVFLYRLQFREEE